MSDAASPLSPQSSPRTGAALVSVLLPAAQAALLDQLDAILLDTPHEVLLLYGGDDPHLDQLDALARTHPVTRLVRALPGPAGDVRAAIPVAAGDVLVTFQSAEGLQLIPQLAAHLREHHCDVAVPAPRRALLGAKVFRLITGIATSQPASPVTALSAAFLEKHPPETDAPFELLAKAHLYQARIGELPADVPNGAPNAAARSLNRPWLWKVLGAPLAVWSVWLVMIVAAVTTFLLTRDSYEIHHLGAWTNLVALAVAPVPLLIAVRRVRGRMRFADAFLPLVLLNPLLYGPHTAPFDPTLLSTGLLCLMTGAIIAQKADDLLRYVSVAALALALTALADVFLMMLPALVLWLVISGYLQARAALPRERARGLMVMAAGEAALVVFCIISFIGQPVPTPAAPELFAAIMRFAEYPLLVVAILMLALGWRSGPSRKPAPYFPGMLALLVGLLTMILNNFQAGKLPEPGADQTALVLCLVYVVFALHGPRRLQWIAPPILLILAALYTVSIFQEGGLR